MTSSDYSIFLSGIEAGARTAARNAAFLPSRPAFETRAEDELAKAREILTEALENVIKAQALYQGKPVYA